MTLQTILPLNPPMPYLGGKSKLADLLAATLTEIPHQRYVECFFGMGSVFFRRSLVPKFEVINDINRELTNFFRVAQRHGEELAYQLECQLQNRHDYDVHRHANLDGLTDIERAVRFYVLQRSSFGGKVSGQCFAMDKSRSRLNMPRRQPELKRLHHRLAGVLNEHL